MKKEGASDRGSTRREPIDAVDLELRSMRKGEGLTHSRIRRTALLWELCGAEIGDAAEVYQRIVEAVSNMDQQSVKIRALHNALNLAPVRSTDVLKLRRLQFAESIGRNTDTVEIWENEAFDELRHLLERVSQDEYRYLEAASKVLVDQRCIVQQMQWRRVKCLGSTLQACSHWDEDDATIEVVTPDCHMERYVGSPTDFKVVFDPPLKRGEIREYAYKAIYPQYEVTDPFGHVSQEFEIGPDLYTVQVRFVGEVPTRIWRFHRDRLNWQDSDDEPRRPENILRLDGRGVVSASFRRTDTSLRSGIAWSWRK